uniref:Uncharacterized protein n=1 Tax=Rhizophora mucronata TaxID=61149 RepID=A0A2P2LJ44_RHIMU
MEKKIRNIIHNREIKTTQSIPFHVFESFYYKISRENCIRFINFHFIPYFFIFF